MMSVDDEVDRAEFRAWLKANGIELPNLGINWPAGNAWGAAENIIHLRRRWQEVKRKDEAIRHSILECRQVKSIDEVVGAIRHGYQRQVPSNFGFTKPENDQ